MNWRESFRIRKFRIEFLITVVLIILTLLILASFLNFIETRDGEVINDPLLNLIKPVDLTWITFGLIYISLIIALFSFFKNPSLFLFALQTYIVMNVFRIIAMFLLPLNPPANMIPLSDPFVEFFGTGQLLTKDLFFSGHTATLFLLFLLTDLKILKTFFFISTIIVGLCVLFQHVHYSIDIFAAPFFSFCSFKLTEKFRNKLPVF